MLSISCRVSGKRRKSESILHLSVLAVGQILPSGNHAYIREANGR